MVVKQRDTNSRLLMGSLYNRISHPPPTFFFVSVSFFSIRSGPAGAAARVVVVLLLRVQSWRGTKKARDDECVIVLVVVVVVDVVGVKALVVADMVAMEKSNRDSVAKTEQKAFIILLY